MMVCNIFDAQNLLFICLQISPQIFAIVQKFALDNFRDQQFCNLLCELERVVMVLFTGNALEVEVPPGMVCDRSFQPGEGLLRDCETLRRFVFSSRETGPGPGQHIDMFFLSPSALIRVTMYHHNVFTKNITSRPSIIIMVCTQNHFQAIKYIN